MDNDIKNWRENNAHLPEFLKDFHNQKEFFNLIFDTMAIDELDPLKDINSLQAHVLTLDVVLWKLAQYGYTLQKSRVKKDFDDIEQAISQNSKRRQEQFLQVLKTPSDK